jgi:hypothetical protein
LNQIDTNIVMPSVDASRRKFSSSNIISQNPENDAENRSDLWARTDAFEMLREKITGITRSMQEFQIQELLFLQDDDEAKKYAMERSNSCLSPVSISSSFSSSIPPSGLSRFSLVRSDSVSSAFSNITPHVLQTRQTTRSQCHFSSAASSSSSSGNNSTFQLAQDSNGISEKEDQLDLPSYPQHPLQRYHHSSLNEEKLDFSNYKISTWSQLEVDGKEHDSGSSRSISPLWRSVSLNSTALFPQSSDMTHSKLDELSETMSLSSSPSSISFPDFQDEREWKEQYMNLISTCITQSEQLENLSTEALVAEKKVRELMLTDLIVDEQFRQREYQYEQRLRECQEVSIRQLHMIECLEELAAEINMKLERPESSRSGAVAERAYHTENETTNQDHKRISISKRLKDSADNVVHKLRWEIGMFVGGGVGTGHVVHSFKGSLKGTDVLITGSGATRVSQHDSSMEDERVEQAELPVNNTQEVNK